MQIHREREMRYECSVVDNDIVGGFAEKVSRDRRTHSALFSRGERRKLKMRESQESSSSVPTGIVVPFHLHPKTLRQPLACEIAYNVNRCNLSTELLNNIKNKPFYSVIFV